MTNHEIAALINSMSGADATVVEAYLDAHGLERFVIESSTIEGISDEAKERLDEINLFLQEVSHAAV